MQKEQESVPVTAEPEQPQQPEPPVVKKSNKKLWTVLAVVVGVIAIGGGVAYALLSQTTEKQASNTNPTEFASAKILVDSAKSGLTGQVADITVSNGLGGKTEDGYGLYGIAPHKVGNRAFENLPAESNGVAHKGDSVESKKNYDAIIAFFARNHAKVLTSGTDVTGTISEDNEEVTFVAHASYDAGKQICTVWNVDASDTPIGAHIASVGCADKTSYESAAKSLDAFYASFIVDNKDRYESVVLGSPVVNNDVEGYEYAVVHQELDGNQAEGLYYRATGADTWTHQVTTRGVAFCDEFDTDDAKKVFNGFECLTDASEVTTVKS